MRYETRTQNRGRATCCLMDFRYQVRGSWLGGALLAGLAASSSAARLAASSDKAPLDRTVRIGVFGLFRPQELRVRAVPGEVLLIEAGSETLTLEGSEQADVRTAGQAVECLTSRGTIQAPVVHVAARSRDPESGDFVLAVPGKLERRFRGTLEISVGKSWLDTEAAGRDTLVPVVTMRLQTAVASVVEAESPPNAGPEALKAQAVAARSYFVAGYLAGRPRHSGFDFCDTTHCQFLRSPSGRLSPASLATFATRGMILTYHDTPVAALYSASCGGRTRTLAEAGMVTTDSSYPYFAVDCPYCARHARTWTARFEDLNAGAETVRAKALRANALSVMTGALLVQGVSSETARLRAARRVGWSVLPGNDYEVESEGGALVVRGRGAGHGLGLCQEGARGMAEAGADFRAILSYFFPNTRIGSIP